MQLRRLGCFSGVGIISAVITVLVIAGMAFTRGGSMFSPGMLNADPGRQLGGVASHAEIGGNCKACHAAPWQAESMNELCIGCHNNIATELEDLNSIHGKLKGIDPKAQCRDCHPEHKGSHAPLTVLEEWNFPHQVTGYLLDGHQAKAGNEPFLCSDCHGPDVTTIDIFVCRDCHKLAAETFMLDHGIAFGAACLNCHDGLDTYGNNFDHNVYVFPLTGGHSISLCSQCHLASNKISDLKLTPQTCSACHGSDDPHGGNLGADCSSCHTTTAWKPANFDHNRASFSLMGAHITVACDQCHTDTFFVGTPMECIACHGVDEPHAGRFGTNCAACHKSTAWTDWTFDHTLSAFQLTGMHATTACEACHKSGYQGTPKDCFSCHRQDEPHKGQFGAACENCHVTSGWRDVTFNHNRTAFPLTGQHNSVNCQACHANGVYRGIAKNCYACHAARDVHKGQFGTVCASCHVTSGWRDVNFDHNTTGFPLTGQHKITNCTTCHTNGQFKGISTSCVACHASDDHHNGQFGRECSTCHNTSTWGGATFNHNNTAFPLTGRHINLDCTSCHANGVYRGTPTDCFACHASRDAHNGQFGTNCGSCHSTNGWGGATFNHNNTGFPLTGRHNNLSCTSCHANGVFQGTPANCYACHSSDDKHGGRFGTNCAACHSTNGWGNASFDHNITSFPLEGKHRGVSCESCHRNGVYQGLSTSCNACHEDKHQGENGANCTACHTPNGWGK